MDSNDNIDDAEAQAQRWRDYQAFITLVRQQAQPGTVIESLSEAEFLAAGLSQRAPGDAPVISAVAGKTNDGGVTNV